MQQSRKIWLNIYPKGQTLWPSKEAAVENARASCIAVAVEQTVVFTEGQGREAAAARV